MGRSCRYVAAGAYYHVSTTGNNGAAIFRDDGDRSLFMHMLGRIAERYDWRIHAHSLLGNHYHLVVETRRPNLSDGMRDLNGDYARAFNTRYARKHHLFGQRFWSKVIESEDQYDQTVDYVVHNAVHHEFVRRIEDWGWTSWDSVGGIDSARVARHRQADPAALPGRVPDGRAPGADGTGREVERRGLLRDVRRGVRSPLLLGSRRVAGSRRPAPVPARRVHRRRALHAPVGE